MSEQNYIINSAVITLPGTYFYELVTERAAVAWLRSWARKGGFLSRVGYPATARHIEGLSGISVPLSREAIAMAPGDIALVVRLRYRLANPADKRNLQPGPDDWEYGLLRRLA